MKLSPIEAKLLYRAAKRQFGWGLKLLGLLPESNEVPASEYENAAICLGRLAGESNDLACVRACRALEAKFEAAKS
jgi:hypothetical protein